MNKVNLTGRLTKDPEVAYSQKDGKNICRASFTLAVDRRFGEGADFIRCVAFGKTGEFIEKYFKKGNKIGVSGRIQTGSYQNKEGHTVYTTDVICEELEFGESKKESTVPGVNMAVDFEDIPEGFEEELPFV